MTSPRAYVVAMFALFAALGVVQAYVQVRAEDPRIVTMVSMFTIAPLLFAWCKADAAYRAITPPPAAALMVGVLALVGIPYYFLKILPVRRAIAAIARALGTFVLLTITAGAANLVAQHAFAS